MALVPAGSGAWTAASTFGSATVTATSVVAAALPACTLAGPLVASPIRIHHACAFVPALPCVTVPPDPPPPPPPAPVGKPDPPTIFTVVVEVLVIQVSCVAAPTVKANQLLGGIAISEVVALAPSLQYAVLVAPTLKAATT